MKVFEAIAGEPWCIQEEALRTILDIAALAREERQELDIEALSAKLGKPLGNSRTASIREGSVATIPIIGPIFRYANLFTRISGAASLDIVARDFQAALDNPAVRAIVLEIDSPGGETAGLSEMAGRVYAARAVKPVVAHVSHLGASAAYWLASAAEFVSISPTSMLGSIGTIMAVPAERGSRTIEIVSSQSPRKRPDVQTDEGKAQFQAVADAVTEQFIADVARFRGVSEETVLSDFGQGWVLIGQAAVDAGMADAIGDFEQIVSQLAAGQVPDGGTVPARSAAGTHAQTGEKERGMSKSLWDKVRSVLGAVEDDDAPGGEEQQPAQQPPAQAAAVRTVTVADASVVAENERLRAELARERETRLLADATAFADGEVRAERAYPAERQGIVAAYLQAARDDAEKPATVAYGEGKEAFSAGSRVEALRAVYGSRAKHGLTEEQLRAGAPEGAVLLQNPQHTAAAGEEQPVSAERKRELLDLTPLGRAAVGARERNGGSH